jgi:hypothetical protein
LGNSDKSVKHTNFEVHILNDPKPEVFLLNFNYANVRSSPQEVLSILISIPETFTPTDLYNAAAQKDTS